MKQAYRTFEVKEGRTWKETYRTEEQETGGQTRKGGNRKNHLSVSRETFLN